MSNNQTTPSREFIYPIGKQMLADMKIILSASLDELRKSLTVLTRLEVKAGTSIEMESALSTLIDRSLSAELTSFLRGMRRNIDQFDFKVSELIRSVSLGLENTDEAESLLPLWRERVDLIESMIESKAVHLSVKISDLMLLSSKHIHNISIVTEMIPVFDEDRSSIAGQIVKNVIYIKISDQNENEELISLPLGEEDLSRINSQVNNAIKKSELIRQMFSVDGRFVNFYRNHP